MLSAIAKLLRLASFVICLIVIASFVIFAANQTKSASNEQQEVLSGTPAAPAGGGSSTGKSAKFHKSRVHKTLDEASAELTSPFDGIFSGSHSQWATRGGKLILALLVYGFGLGYIARIVRVRL